MASRWLAVDKTLFFAAIALIAFGLIMVYSASFPLSESRWGTGSHFVLRQGIAALAGLLAMIAAVLIDYRKYRRPIVVGSAVLATIAGLIVVFTMPTIGGVHRWIPLVGFNVQPSEIAKLTVILFLASHLARKDGRINDLWYGLAPAASVVALIALLVAIEPDLGTAATIVSLAGIMLWVAGLSWKFIAQIGGGVLVLGAVQILRTGYQSRRITAFLDPWADPGDAGYQTVQSLIAVGSGGLTGEGLAAGRQKLFFLPAAHTDFIFSIVGEELGLLGAVTVLLGFLVIVWRGARAALRAPDRFGFYLGIGLTTFVILQAFVNMSIVVNLLPTTGIPLPFVSYGGSSMVVCCAAIGVLLNLSQHGHA